MVQKKGFSLYLLSITLRRPQRGWGWAGACVPYIHLQTRGASCPLAPQEQETCSPRGFEQSRETGMPLQLLGPGWLQEQSRNSLVPMAGLCPVQAAANRWLQTWQHVPDLAAAGREAQHSWVGQLQAAGAKLPPCPGRAQAAAGE